MEFWASTSSINPRYFIGYSIGRQLFFYSLSSVTEQFTILLSHNLNVTMSKYFLLTRYWRFLILSYSRSPNNTATTIAITKSFTELIKKRNRINTWILKSILEWRPTHITYTICTSSADGNNISQIILDI